MENWWSIYQISKMNQSGIHKEAEKGRIFNQISDKKMKPTVPLLITGLVGIPSFILVLLLVIH